MCRSDYAQDVVDNYKKLGRTADLAAVPIEEARKLYGGIFNEADYDGVKEVLVNKTSGWAAAGDCLRAITREVIRLGVKYVTADVASLNFDFSNRCTGVLTKSGKSLSASHVILSTGAFTPKLLEQSAAKSGLSDLRAGDRILAAGITTGMTKLDEKSLETYASMPVGVQGYTAQTGTSWLGVHPHTFVDNSSRTIHRQSTTDPR
jgi:glycine/D-amino acid oxidase-like deaminating enzyme